MRDKTINVQLDKKRSVDVCYTENSWSIENVSNVSNVRQSNKFLQRYEQLLRRISDLVYVIECAIDRDKAESDDFLSAHDIIRRNNGGYDFSY